MPRALHTVIAAVSALCMAGTVLVCATAHAATVVLVRTPRPSAVTTEATVRLQGELVSAGFSVRVIDPPSGTDVRSVLEQVAAAPDVEAVVAIIGPGWDDTSSRHARNSAEVWVIDRVTGKTVMRQVPNEPAPGRGAEVLSVRALELLRASFLEVALMASSRPPNTTAHSGVTPSSSASPSASPSTSPSASPSPSPSLSSPPLQAPPPPPKEVTRWTDAALSEAMYHRGNFTSTWSVEAGGCVLGSMEGFAPSVMPLARVQHAFGDHLLGRVTLAGLGTRTHFTHHFTSMDAAQADVVQQFGLVEGALRWRRNKTWQPFLSAGVGLLHLAASGQQSRPPIEVITSERWSLLADVGGGVHVSFRRFELALEAHAQAARPYPVIRFLNEEVAREGRPTLVSSLTFLVWM